MAQVYRIFQCVLVTGPSLWSLCEAGVLTVWLPTAGCYHEDEEEGDQDCQDDGDDDGAEAVSPKAYHLCSDFAGGADVDLVV